LHTTALREALQIFDASATFGSKTDIVEARKKLESDVAEAQEQVVRENKLKIDQSLVKYAPAVMILFVSFFIDKLSDYTCDWWLESCRQASTLLVLIYVGIFVFVGFVTYQLHEKRGGVAAVQGLIALGQASSRMGMEVALQVKEKGVELATQLSSPSHEVTEPTTHAKSE